MSSSVSEAAMSASAADIDGDGDGKALQKYMNILSQLVQDDDHQASTRSSRFIDFFRNLSGEDDAGLQLNVLESFAKLIERKPKLISGCESLIELLVFMVYTIEKRRRVIASDIRTAIQCKLFWLVGLIGKHNLRVKDLNKLLMMFNDVANGQMTSLVCPLLLTALGDMSSSNTPTSFFEFTGDNAALVLQRAENRGWPAPKSYTFACWMRYEPELSSHGAARFIFSFLTSRGYGVELALTKAGQAITMAVSSQSAKQRIVVPTEQLGMRPKIWYFFVVCHSKPATFSRSPGHCQFYVNGALRYHTELAYPNNASEPVTFSAVGASMLHSDSKNPTSFLGQMGTVYFFTEALSQELVRHMYGRGPDYTIRSSSTTSSSNWLKSMSSGISSIYKRFSSGSGTSASSASAAGSQAGSQHPAATSDAAKMSEAFRAVLRSLMFLYHPRCMQDRVCKDTSPLYTSNREGVHASASPGVNVHTRQVIGDVVQCSAGGIATLFPLFHFIDRLSAEEQLDAAPASALNISVTSPGLSSPSPKSNSPLTTTPSLTSTADLKITSTLLPLMLRMVSNTLVHRVSVQQEMLHVKGFSITAYLLTRASPAHLTEETVAALELLLQQTSWMQVTGASRDGRNQNNSSFNALSGKSSGVGTTMDTKHMEEARSRGSIRRLSQQMSDGDLMTGHPAAQSGSNGSSSQAPGIFASTNANIPISYAKRRTLFNDVVCHLLLNFKLWTRPGVPQSVQCEVVRLVNANVQRQPVYFRELLSVQYIVDCLRRYIPYTLADSHGTGVHAALVYRHRASHHDEKDSSVLVRRAPIVLADLREPNSKVFVELSEIHTLRSHWLTTLRVMILRGASSLQLRDVEVIVRAMAESSDPLQIAEFARVLTDLIVKNPKATVAHVNSLGGVSVFVHMLQSPFSEFEFFQLALLHIIAMLLHFTSDRDDGHIRAAVFPALVEALFPRPFTANIYYALAEIAFDVVPGTLGVSNVVESFVAGKLSVQDPQHALLDVDRHARVTDSVRKLRIRFPRALTAMFALARSPQSSMHVLFMLQHVYASLSSAGNCNALLSTSLIEEVINILVWHDNSALSGAGIDPSKAKALSAKNNDKLAADYALALDPSLSTTQTTSAAEDVKSDDSIVGINRNIVDYFADGDITTGAIPDSHDDNDSKGGDDGDDNGDANNSHNIDIIAAGTATAAGRDGDECADTATQADDLAASSPSSPSQAPDQSAQVIKRVTRVEAKLALYASTAAQAVLESLCAHTLVYVSGGWRQIRDVLGLLKFSAETQAVDESKFCARRRYMLVNFLTRISRAARRRPGWPDRAGVQRLQQNTNHFVDFLEDMVYFDYGDWRRSIQFTEVSDFAMDQEYGDNDSVDAGATSNVASSSGWIVCDEMDDQPVNQQVEAAVDATDAADTDHSEDGALPPPPPDSPPANASIFHPANSSSKAIHRRLSSVSQSNSRASSTASGPAPVFRMPSHVSGRPLSNHSGYSTPTMPRSQSGYSTPPVHRSLLRSVSTPESYLPRSGSNSSASSLIGAPTYGSESSTALGYGYQMRLAAMAQAQTRSRRPDWKTHVIDDVVIIDALLDMMEATQLSVRPNVGLEMQNVMEYVQDQNSPGSVRAGDPLRVLLLFMLDSVDFASRFIESGLASKSQKVNEEPEPLNETEIADTHDIPDDLPGSQDVSMNMEENMDAIDAASAEDEDEDEDEDEAQPTISAGEDATTGATLDQHPRLETCLRSLMRLVSVLVVLYRQGSSWINLQHSAPPSSQRQSGRSASVATPSARQPVSMRRPRNATGRPQQLRHPQLPRVSAADHHQRPSAQMHVSFLRRMAKVRKAHEDPVDQFHAFVDDVVSEFKAPPKSVIWKNQFLLMALQRLCSTYLSTMDQIQNLESSIEAESSDAKEEEYSFPPPLYTKDDILKIKRAYVDDMKTATRCISTTIQALCKAMAPFVVLTERDFRALFDSVDCLPDMLQQSSGGDSDAVSGSPSSQPAFVPPQDPQSMQETRLAFQKHLVSVFLKHCNVNKTHVFVPISLDQDCQYVISDPDIAQFPAVADRAYVACIEHVNTTLRLVHVLSKRFEREFTMMHPVFEAKLRDTQRAMIERSTSLASELHSSSAPRVQRWAYIEASRRAEADMSEIENLRIAEDRWNVLSENGLFGDRSPWTIGTPSALSSATLSSFISRSTSSMVPSKSPEAFMLQSDRDRANGSNRDSDDSVFWEIDPTEDACRMRRKLRRFQDGSAHRKACRRYSSSDLDNSIEALEADEEQELQRSFHTLRRLSIANPADASAFRHSGSAHDSADAELENPQLHDSMSDVNGPIDLHAQVQDGHVARDASEWDFCEPEEQNGPQFAGARRTFPRSALFSSGRCTLVLPIGKFTGRLDVGTTFVRFIYFEDPDAENADDYDSHFQVSALHKMRQRWKKDRTWSLSDLTAIYRRRYNLRRCAVEMFIVDGTNYFFAFDTAEDMSNTLRRILQLQPPHLFRMCSLQPTELIRRSNVTAKWQRREISNFEYLMYLNTTSGRTYNDLNQYPVFPWVIKWYDETKDFHIEQVLADSQPQLNIWTEHVFRDLSKPIGALNEKRLASILERCRTFTDMDVPEFHYGSHYSNPATVLYFLLRLEPFASLHIELQAGKFDFPDRLFSSVGQTWKNCLTSLSAFKELTPEFYYLPEFFENMNKYNFGRKQDGQVVDDVLLPPWASDARDFVRINRLALESEYVSQNLHRWIDLIFGYQQRGEEAKKANNLFFHLTYEGAVDMDSIDDPILLRAVQEQISHFGQVPIQLFDRPHPTRAPLSSVQQQMPFRSLMSGSARAQAHALSRTLSTGATNVSSPPPPQSPPPPLGRPGSGAGHPLLRCFLRHRISEGQPLLTVSAPLLSNQNPTMFSVSADFTVAAHTWIENRASPHNDMPFTYALQGRSVFYHPNKPTQHSLQFSPDGSLLYVGNNFDDSLRVYTCASVASGQQSEVRCQLTQYLAHHKGTITCVAVSSDGQTVVTGSSDCTLLVWHVLQNQTGMFGGSKTRFVQPVPHCRLRGHEDTVAFVAVETDLDICVSISESGVCLMHTLRKGMLVRELTFPNHVLPTRVLISKSGDLLFYNHPRGNTDDSKASASTGSLVACTVNGRYNRSSKVTSCITAMLASPDGQLVVLGDASGVVRCLRSHNLTELGASQALGSPISSLSFSAGMRYLLAGTDSGELVVFHAI
jgi:WD40 repeat protein